MLFCVGQHYIVKCAVHNVILPIVKGITYDLTVTEMQPTISLDTTGTIAVELQLLHFRMCGIERTLTAIFGFTKNQIPKNLPVCLNHRCPGHTECLGKCNSHRLLSCPQMEAHAPVLPLY